MLDRKDIRRRARSILKRHYLLLVMLCAISVFLGTEFTEITDEAQTWYDTLRGNVTELDVTGVKGSRGAAAQILDDLLEDNLEAGREKSAALIQQIQAETDIHSVLGRSRGVFAALVNSVGSGQMLVLIGTALHGILHNEGLSMVLIILTGMAVQAMIWVFFRNIYGAVLRRAVLELRSYRSFPLSHLFYVRNVGRWARAARTMLLPAAYETLWWLTVVGGPIKHYAYFLVPFIVAENPDIRPRQAVALSRRMMAGHKWECFLLDLSYLGWRLLGFVTFGVVQLLWTVPYRVAGYAEFYADLRQKSLERGVPGSELLHDGYLYAKAEPDRLRAAYPEIARHEALIEEEIVELPPLRRFFAHNFGIWTSSLIEKKVYSRQAGLRQQTRVERLELNGAAYPNRLNPLWKSGRDLLNVKVSYLTPCTFWSLVAVFFAFCFVGWVWEVSLHLVTEGVFVNRGALHGPWIPIYGSGVTMIAVLLYRLRRRPVLEALGVIVLCGLVEYFTSYFMELSSGMRWWDYTGYFLNLDGRICGEGLAVFCAGGMAAVYLGVPVIDARVTRLKPKVLISVCLVLLALFAGDVVYSHYVPNTGKGITDYQIAAVAVRDGENTASEKS